MNKSAWLVVILAVGLARAASAKTEYAEVNLDYVAKRAEDRAHKPFRSPRADLPDVLRADKLNYDNYREIEFRHDRALWASEKLPFSVEFFHPGYLYEEPVHINEFNASYVQTVRFSQDFFNYRALTELPKHIPADTGYAGFRVLHTLNQPDKMDELGSFLGASYYRVLGKGQRYGLSARGLAVDSGETDRPEEFPIFTDWWLGKPQPGDKELHLFAILDSVSCAGAYEFKIHPGETTTVDVDGVIFLRATNLVAAADANKKPVVTLGLGPLTSMFWFGENSERKFDDARPEVHDSDGLLARMENGETLWRPLNNASVMRHQRFGADNIRGFGLLQRDRDPKSYEDIFNFYNRVPSVWIEPRGKWGPGELHLVELSTWYEGLDNIVAFWSPRTMPPPGKPFRFGYTMFSTRETDRALSENRVIATRIGADSRNAARRQVVIDFAGPRLAKFTELQPPESVVSCSENAHITENQIFKNPFDGSWRVIMKFEPTAGSRDTVDLRCTLNQSNAPVTETWTYHWSPP